MLGDIGRNEYVNRILLQFTIVDKLNSVPWAYGLRAKCGTDHSYFAEIVPAKTAVNPASKHPRTFQTSVEQQQCALLEVLKGEPGLAHLDEVVRAAVNLPTGLPKGTRVTVTLSRGSDAELSVTLDVPSHRFKSSITLSHGFHDLSAHVHHEQHGQRSLGLSGDFELLMALIDRCRMFVRDYGDHLTEKDGALVVGWIDKALHDLELDESQALQNVLKVMLEDLRPAKALGVVFLGDALVGSIAPSLDIRQEFRRRARFLLDGQGQEFVLQDVKQAVVKLIESAWQEYMSRQPQGRKAIDLETVTKTLLRALDADQMRSDEFLHSLQRTETAAVLESLQVAVNEQSIAGIDPDEALLLARHGLTSLKLAPELLSALNDDAAAGARLLYHVERTSRHFARRIYESVAGIESAAPSRLRRSSDDDWLLEVVEVLGVVGDAR